MKQHDFQFFRDRHHILWRETFWMNGLRASFAGIGLFVLALFTETPEPMTALTFGIVYFVAFLPMALFVMMLVYLSIPALSEMLGLALWVMGLAVSLGDPFVFVLSRIRPEFVPAESPSFFSGQVVCFILSPYR